MLPPARALGKGTAKPLAMQSVAAAVPALLRGQPTGLVLPGYRD